MSLTRQLNCTIYLIRTSEGPANASEAKLTAARSERERHFMNVSKRT